jgi:hypothetical protein
VTDGTATDRLTADRPPAAGPPTPSPATAEPPTDSPPAGGPVTGGRARRVAARVLTVLAGLLVLVALVAPNEIARLTPGAVLRIPIEGVLGVALLLVLPPRPRRVAATVAGVGLGLLAIVRILDMGFLAVLVRPFDPVLDWTLLGSAVEFLTGSVGRGGATAAVAGVVALAVATIVLMTLAVRRLTRLAARRRTASARAVAVLALAWVVCAVLGAQIVADVPVASASTASLVHDRALQVRAGLQDRQAFAAESAVDAYRDTPADELLTALRGKDVVVAFVESYGRVAVEDPDLAPQVGALLDDGTQRLEAAGFTSRSAFLTAPVAGGHSWLAHATLLSGLWIDNQQRHDTLVASDRLTLPEAFRRASWRPVTVMPNTTRAWPEGAFYGYERVYGSRDLGDQGPRLSWAIMPDQYTLSAFERLERSVADRSPLMAEIALVSSHAPWTGIPGLVDWADIGDGSVFDELVEQVDPRAGSWGTDTAQVRADYRNSIEYSLGSLISYVETYGDDDLVLVLLGDHQPAPIVTGADAGRDVPVTIIAGDPAVLDRVAGWGWDTGLRPGPQAPVWRMDAFRDRFLAAFGP